MVINYRNIHHPQDRVKVFKLYEDWELKFEVVPSQEGKTLSKGRFSLKTSISVYSIDNFHCFEKLF